MVQTTVSVKSDVYERLKLVRFDLSTSDRIITYSDAIDQLIAVYLEVMNRQAKESPYVKDH